MSWARRAAARSVWVLALILLPILHCRQSEIRSLDPELVFSAPGPQPEVEEATAPRSWETIPLSGRLVARLPRESGPWRWAAADGVTMAARSEGSRPEVLIYSEPMPSGPWASLELDAFVRTVVPGLSSSALPIWVRQAPGVREGLEREHGLSTANAIDLAGRLRSRTLGRGLGFRGRRASFGGWRWQGINAHGVELRLAALDGVWGAQDELPSRCFEVLEQLRLDSGVLPDLGIARSGLSPLPERTARMVLGTARRKSGFGVHLAILHLAEPEPALAKGLASFLEGLRSPRSGAMEPLLADRTAGDLERLARQLGLEVQIAPRRVHEEDLIALGRHFEERQAGSP